MNKIKNGNSVKNPSLGITEAVTVHCTIAHYNY